ncbi:hypothetical protein AVEN_110859-1, partial [Araneus ventricosus]
RLQKKFPDSIPEDGSGFDTRGRFRIRYQRKVPDSIQEEGSGFDTSEVYWSCCTLSCVVTKCPLVSVVRKFGDGPARSNVDLVI